MKFESFALYMRAIVYHMNYLEKRKEIDEVLKSLDSLAIQKPAGTPDLNLNDSPDLNMYNTTILNKCSNCSSSNVEFDSSLDRLVCMGCGGEIDYRISLQLKSLQTMDIV